MTIRISFLIGIALLCHSTLVAEDNLTWQAGVASAKVTPETPMWMAGYASRNKPSEGTLQDLFVKALALQDDDGKRLVIITCDLISVPRPIRDDLEKAVKEKCNLPPEGLLINCSHTHCGPEIRTTRWSLDGLPPQRLKQANDYVTRLQSTLVKLVESALSDLAPSRISYCRARCGLAMNRRTPSATGFRNFPNPDGPVDHDVPVLKVESPEGKLRAILFGYACHNTTLGIFEFCGDYAGYAQAYLEAAHPEATAMFVMGCGGDQNPYPRRTIELAQQHGRSLANAVETALETQARPITASLRTAYDTATVKYQTAPTKSELQKKAESNDKYDRIHAERLLRQLESDGKLREKYDCPVQVVRLGEQVTLVALPGETVVDYSLRLKNELSNIDGSGPAVWVAGYSNDVFAYVPSRRVLLEGGYEAGGAMRYMTTVLQHGPFKPDVEERIVTKVHELYRALANQ
ncbi:neutral/alkaline non-lysosomal ceramidase N-terminal domain-containing protein [Fuerstiella marisgermanici]|uniref:Neutral ceramidase n=1 Tax=Fuerstiella marisgermanici TaxID=1891926 RepID=A0A1P8WNP8_9PLAN|nr:neutral/alkaline non-lysosomal ceramidase N-terminal domain-containing protein [Fuerstiella marisgermanici]APZ95665.1 Neutral ceramidase [Fuerstiella marisgermanici]